jgi:positive regulator of sigma E activity
VMCYLVPAAMMLAGAGLAGSVSRFAGDGGALLGAALGLALGGVVLRLYDSRREFGAWQVEPVQQDSPAGAG